MILVGKIVSFRQKMLDVLFSKCFRVFFIIRRCNLKIPNKAKRSVKYVTALRRNQCFSLRFLLAANWLTKELHWSVINGCFYSTFSRKLNGEKTQGLFWPKTQSWRNFYLMNKETKTQNMGEKLRIFPYNSTGGQPLAAKWCPNR